MELLALCPKQPYKVLCWRGQVCFLPQGSDLFPHTVVLHVFIKPPTEFFPFCCPLRCQHTYPPFCCGRSLRTNSCRETLVLTELCSYCCVFTGNGVHSLYNWEELFLWCIDSAVWYSSTAGEFSLVLELLGWGALFLTLANSLFPACSFMPHVHWTVWVPSQSRENSALHAQGTWINFGVPWLDECHTFSEELKCYIVPQYYIH